ncbi:MAG TPA: trypsin-like peptidase domain-containing protein, partial [Pseudonocardiaceae bacterium]
MTENLPGAAGGPAEDPRHTDERAEALQAQPTGEHSGSSIDSGVGGGGGGAGLSGPLEPPNPQPVPQPIGGPTQWSPPGFAYYGNPPSTPPGGYPPTGPQGGPPTGPLTAGYRIATEPDPRRRGPGGLVVGIAALALVVGGLAGGLGGYLAAGHSGGPVISSLTQPGPASPIANAPAGSVQAVANKVLPVVVTIAAEFQVQGSASGDTGSGFIISSDGNILTNNHVIAGAVGGGRIQVIFADGRTVDATIVGRDPTTDIAVIKAKGVTGLPVAALGRSGDLAVGQSVVA